MQSENQWVGYITYAPLHDIYCRPQCMQCVTPRHSENQHTVHVVAIMIIIQLASYYGDEPCHECIDDRPATFREASQLPLCRSGKPIAGQPPRSPSTQTQAFEGPNRSRLGLLVVNLSAQEEFCVYRILFCATSTISPQHIKSLKKNSCVSGRGFDLAYDDVLKYEAQQCWEFPSSLS